MTDPPISLPGGRVLQGQWQIETLRSEVRRLFSCISAEVGGIVPRPVSSSSDFSRDVWLIIDHFVLHSELVSSSEFPKLVSSFSSQQLNMQGGSAQESTPQWFNPVSDEAQVSQIYPHEDVCADTSLILLKTTSPQSTPHPPQTAVRPPSPPGNTMKRQRWAPMSTMLNEPYPRH